MSSAIFRSLDSVGDWNFGQGYQSYLTGEPALVADINTSLKMFLGDCFFAINIGVDWWNLLGAMNPTAQENIVQQCRQVLAGVSGVVRVVSVTVAFNSGTRVLTITYVIDTVYSQSVQSSISL